MTSNNNVVVMNWCPEKCSGDNACSGMSVCVLRTTVEGAEVFPGR